MSAESYIVRHSWDTGHEDFECGSEEDAKKRCRKEIARLRKDGVKDPEKWVKIFQLTPLWDVYDPVCPLCGHDYERS